MLKGPSSTKGNHFAAWLIKPTSGSNKKVHPTVVESEGSMKDTQNINSKPRLKGIRVRARIQAIVTAKGKLMDV